MWYAYTHNGVLLSLKREGNSDTCYNMDGPWRHAQWNNLVTKRQAAFYLVAQELPAQENHLGRVMWMSFFFPILLHVNFPTSKIFYLAGPELGWVVFLQDPQGICSHDETQPCQLIRPFFRTTSQALSQIAFSMLSFPTAKDCPHYTGRNSSFKGLWAPPVGLSSKL